MGGGGAADHQFLGECADSRQGMGIIRVSPEKLTASLDIRYPITANPDMLQQLIAHALPGFEVKCLDCKEPHYVPENSELVQELLNAYHQVTGLPKGTLAIGGGTYARSLEEGVAFGALFPGEADVAHQADENVLVDNLYRNMRIFAHAIVKLAGKQNG